MIYMLKAVGEIAKVLFDRNDLSLDDIRNRWHFTKYDKSKYTQS